MKSLFTIVILFLSTTACQSQTLHVHVTGIRNNSGNIRLAFYNNGQSFDNEKALFIKTAAKTGLVKDALHLTYADIKPGIYGIAILDDENKNEKMDYGLILPKEGFGFSDYYHTGMKRPKFDSFDFVLKNEIKSVEIKVRYL